jgi:trans-aconitate 2-methyltransferase
VADRSASDYAFGDTPIAADRLALVAQVFEASSRELLSDEVATPPAVALDLGCGPGHSTRLVADATGAARTIGIDGSPAFLAAAREHSVRGVEFVEHDVTDLPLPGTPAELIYGRLLLAHLTDPPAHVPAWISQLRPGGLLLVDEVEWIETSHPVLARYEELVVRVVAAHGGASYAGPIVDRLREGAGWHQRSSRLRLVPVATADAARMYGMNLATWRHDPSTASFASPPAIEQLASDLAALATATSTREITWGIRQVAFVRDE